MEEILYYCERCNKPVYQKIGSGRYCSQSCANSRQNVEKLECQYCHKLFIRANIKKHEASCKENFNNIRNIKLQNWIYEQHTCEKCGKLITEYIGSGRYCSRACANSRDHSEETKQKISESCNKVIFCTNINTGEVKHFYNNDIIPDDWVRGNFKISKHPLEDFIAMTSNNSSDISDNGIEFCKLCGKKLQRRNRSGYCNTCRKSAPELKEDRIIAGKKGAETRKRNGTQNSWQSRNIQSYPEEFWQNVLDNNSIKYEGPNYTLVRPDGHCWFLDFYIEINEYKIDLEIDGKQHKYDDRRVADELRDLYLWSYNYTIYRIDWNEINSEEGKLLMKKKIDDFLEFINDLKNQNN